jgi:small GTP-binding protein
MNPPAPLDVQHKVIFLGESNTGKTSLIAKFLSITVHPTPTVGAASYLISVKLPKGEVKLNCWDTAGQETYRCLVPIYARGAEVACVVYDQSNSASFQSLEKWLDYIDNEIGIKNILIVANKSDLEASVAFPQAAAFCSPRNLELITTSAVSGSNVKLLFSRMAEIVSPSDSNVASPGVEIAKPSASDEGCC